MYYFGPSMANWKEGGYSVIFLNSYYLMKNSVKCFFHELCHPLRHVGNQSQMPELLAELQEIQAALFQQYAALPFYMLSEYMEISSKNALIATLAADFKLPHRFVMKRVDQIENRIWNEHLHRKIYGDPPMEEQKIVVHSPETLKMLNKLMWLSASKGKRMNLG